MIQQFLSYKRNILKKNEVNFIFKVARMKFANQIKEVKIECKPNIQNEITNWKLDRL